MCRLQEYGGLSGQVAGARIDQCSEARADDKSSFAWLLLLSQSVLELPDYYLTQEDFLWTLKVLWRPFFLEYLPALAGKKRESGTDLPGLLDAKEMQIKHS